MAEKKSKDKENKKPTEVVEEEIEEDLGPEPTSKELAARLKKAGNPEKLVKLRNRFFYMFYRYSSLLFVTSIACFITSLLFLFVFIQKPVPPQYIKVDKEGRYIPLDPVDKCRDIEEVKRFMLSAVKRMYKYDYINYTEQLNNAQEYFTPRGWERFLDEFKETKTLFAVKENKWIVTVEPLGVPVLEKTYDDGTPTKTCVMNLKAPIMINYIGSKGQSRKGDIYMRIQRQSVITSDHGLGISQVVFMETK